MKRPFYVGIVIIVMLSMVLVAYGGWLNYNDENQIANRMEERALQLSGAKAEIRNLTPTVELSTVKLYSENMTDAPALIDGRITKIFVTKNNYVRAGDVIMSLTNEQIPLQLQQSLSNIQRAEASYSQALSNVQRGEATLAQAANVYNRQQRLYARKATSQEKLEAAQAEYFAAQEAVKAARAECDSARAAVDLAKTEQQQYLVQQNRQDVTAPIDGNVLLIYKREGAYVQGGTPLALIGDFDTLYFSTTLEDENATYLKPGESVTMIFNERSLQKAYDTEYSAGNLGKSEKICAVVREITPPLNQSAAIRRVLWEINNRAHILEPLTYNNVTMKATGGHKCLTVPLTALADSENDLVFVINADDKIERRKISVGANDGEYVEILSGLSAGEIVVLESFEGLENGLKVDVTLEEGATDGGT